MKLILVVLIGILVLSVSTSYLVSAQSQTVHKGVVYFMKSNSNATIVMKYTLQYSLNGTTNNTMRLYGTNDNDFFNPNLSGITINANPQHSSLEKGSRLVIYTITATNNTKGLYNIPLSFCGTTLFSIGLNESQLDPAILYKYFTARYACPEISDSPQIELVKMTGIISKIITLGQSNASHVTSFEKTILSPLKQIKSGISIENVQCNDGLQLMGKRTDGSPACVRPVTFTKLISLGLGYDPIHVLSFDGLKDTYRVGEPINFRIVFKGYVEEHFCALPVAIAKHENKTVWQSELIILSCPPVSKENAHFRYSQFEWPIGTYSESEKYWNLGTMNLNKTGTYSIIVTWFKSHDIELQKDIVIVS